MTKLALFATASLLTAPPAMAADAAAVDTVQEVIVTGTRAPDHTALTSSVPVAVISAKTLQATGYQDLGRALEFANPSINLPRPQTTPSSAGVRPITLRGLSPDEVLVLVNGKRWHDSALINTNFAVGRGSAPFDISTVPISAIDHVEVLSDGAAAQYGSDAIAGVVNIILKSNSQGGSAAAQSGVTDRGDGANGDLAYSQGFSVPGGGRVTVSAEVSYSGSTDRSGLDQRFNAHDFQIGAPEVQDSNLALSAVLPVRGPELEVYGDLLASRKDSSNAEPFGAPGLSPLYPKGFLPFVNPVLWDVGDTTGVRGDLPAGIRFDLSNTVGYSAVDFTVRKTANVSLGLASPTTFYGGSVRALQDVVDFTLRRAFPEVMAGANVAAGAEYRYDHYQIDKGEPSSIVGTGANSFPGYNPRIPVDNGREAEAVFLDLELKPWRWLALGAAARYDHYSDFGGDTTWKATARAEATAWLAFRASASTGFRAPSLQQEYYSSIQTLANGPNKSLVNVGTFQVRDPVARALGAEPLRPETSTDETIGIEVTLSSGLVFTANVFRTEIAHRIALGDALSGAAVNAVLAANGVTNVQQVAFFANALSTRTEGYDFSLHYDGEFDAATTYAFSLNYQRSPTKVRALTPDSELGRPSFIGTHARLLLTEAQPSDKIVSAFSVTRGRFTGEVRATRYGEYVDAPVLDPQNFSAKIVTDLSLSVRLTPRVMASFGVLNVADVLPDQLQEQALAFKTFGGAYLYGEESPFGADGRAYYVRLSASF
jgi:iron complex outermembrane receptor protein